MRQVLFRTYFGKNTAVLLVRITDQGFRRIAAATKPTYERDDNGVMYKDELSTLSLGACADTSAQHSVLLVVQVTTILGEDNVHSQKPDQLARPEASGTLNDNTGAKSGMSIGSHVSCYEACRGRAHRRGVKSLMHHAPRSDDSSGPLKFTLPVRENVLDCRDTAFECRLGDSSTIFPFYEEVIELLRVRDREPKLSDVIEERDQGFAVPLG